MANGMVRRPCRISPLRRTARDQAHVPWDHARHMVPTTGPVMVVHTGRARCRACWHIMQLSWGPTSSARTPGCLASTTAQRLTVPAGPVEISSTSARSDPICNGAARNSHDVIAHASRMLPVSACSRCRLSNASMLLPTPPVSPSSRLAIRV